MKVVLAFDSFKGAITAQQACRAAAAGVLRVDPHTVTILCPLSDGGEGFAECMKIAGGGVGQTITVTGPLFEPVPADIVWLNARRTAVLEAAQACGLTLVPREKRSPLRTTTYGLGEMIRFAYDAGARQLVIGIGGSSTNDAGVGMLAALGWRFLDAQGDAVPPVGESLPKIQRIEQGQAYPDLEIIAACDVTNPLYGPQGAAHTFAPQKGASGDDVRLLDRGLQHFASLCAAMFGRDLSTSPGSGAAGGLGFALQLFLGATFQPGAEVAISLARLPEHLASADLCFTGEGQTDFQTAFGKLPAAVNTACRTANVPCVCLSGALGKDWRRLYQAGFTALFSICQRPISLPRAIHYTAQNLTDAAEAVTRLMQGRMR